MSTETEINAYHYYGDIIRVLFVISGLIMVASYPFFSIFIKVPILISIIASISLAVFGGLMNPKQKWIMILNTIISIIGFIIFEYMAVYTYLNLVPTKNIHIIFFWTNQILALFFFFASYLSTKTVRGAYIN